MSDQPYYITPDQVSGNFVIRQIADFIDDHCANLFVELDDGQEKCIVYCMTFDPCDPISFRKS